MLFLSGCDNPRCEDARHTCAEPARPVAVQARHRTKALAPSRLMIIGARLRKYGQRGRPPRTAEPAARQTQEHDMILQRDQSAPGLFEYAADLQRTMLSVDSRFCWTLRWRLALQYSCSCRMIVLRAHDARRRLRNIRHFLRRASGARHSLLLSACHERRAHRIMTGLP